MRRSRAPDAPTPGQGSVQDWLVFPLQFQICAWVPGVVEKLMPFSADL